MGLYCILIVASHPPPAPAECDLNCSKESREINKTKPSFMGCACASQAAETGLGEQATAQGGDIALLCSWVLSPASLIKVLRWKGM